MDHNRGGGGPDRHHDRRHHGNKPYHRGRDNRPTSRGGYNRGGGRGGFHGDRRPRQEISADVIAEVTKLFNKKYKFSGSYSLPESDTWFTHSPFKVDELQTYKTQLNTTKDKLNDKDKEIWHRHTRFTNPAGNIMRNVRQQLSAELLTQAWAKFYEMASACNPDNTKFTSVHVCEAPGGFICAQNHYLKRNNPQCQWTWYGMTLNPYFEGNTSKEMVDDDLFISKTYDNWYFGGDNTGDVMNSQNIADLKEHICQHEQDDKSPILLVTADGSIDCQDNPNEQEATVAHLHYCETVTALTLLAPGGNFLLKGFTLFEHSTMCLTYLLCCVFDQVQVVKPLTSKSGNSETYTICTGYKGVSDEQLKVLKSHHNRQGSDNAFFKLSDMPDEFVEEFKKCSKLFMSYQRNMIESNIALFQEFPRERKDVLFQTKDYAVKYYMEHACKGLGPIDTNRRLVPDMRLDGTKLNTTAILSSGGKKGSNRRMQSQSHSQTLKQQSMSWFERTVKPDMEPVSDNSGSKQSFAEKMMAQMGYKEGEGLGKDSDGMQNPVEVSQYKEGTGLGYTVGAKINNAISSAQDINWFKLEKRPLIVFRAVSGRRVDHVTNSRFISIGTLEKLLDAEKGSSVVRQNDLSSLAKSVHMFYTICDVPESYQVSHVQLAYVHKFTNIVSQDGVFADISLGAKFAGFLEKKSSKVYRFESSDGMDNSDSLNKLSEELQGNELDFIISNSNSKFRLISTIYLIIKHMKSGGHCVIQLEKMHDRFRVSIVYLLAHMFQCFAIVKTKACCPHSAEMFVVAQSYKPSPDYSRLISPLQDILKGLERHMNRNRDIVEILPISHLFDHDFYKFVSESNEQAALDAFDMIVDLEKMNYLKKFPSGKSNQFLMNCISETDL